MHEPVAFRTDDWINYVAGIGTSKDKTQGGVFNRSNAIGDEELSAMYYGNAIANKIVYKIPELIHQAGYELVSPNAAAAKALAARVELNAKILDVHWQARLYGAAAGVLLADDGLDPKLPLDVTKVKRFAGINVVDRRYLRVAERFSDIMAPNYGDPMIIEILPQPVAANMPTQTRGAKVHVSRMLLMYGQRVDRRELASAHGFGYSVLQVVYKQLSNGDQAMASLGAMLLEASVSVFKIQNLIAQLTSPNRDVFLERMRVANEQKSTMNSVMVDAEKEDYSRVASQFGGVPESIDRVFQYVAAAADVPMTILFGTSPAGMNATGESDTEQWYNRVSSVRQDSVEPQLRRAYEIVYAALGFPLETFVIEPGPIKTMTPLQEAQYRKAIADAYAVLITNDVLQPEAVALALFGDGDNPAGVPKVNVTELERVLQPTAFVPEGAKVELTPSDVAEIILVWEGREAESKGPLPPLPDGTRNPDNDLTIAAFKAKNAALFAAPPPETAVAPPPGT